MSGAWMSKGPSKRQAPRVRALLQLDAPTTGTAHFVVKGKTLCSAMKLANGTPRLAPFLCSWVPIRGIDKRCGYCARMLGPPREMASQ